MRDDDEEGRMDGKTDTREGRLHSYGRVDTYKLSCTRTVIESGDWLKGEGGARSPITAADHCAAPIRTHRHTHTARVRAPPLRIADTSSSSPRSLTVPSVFACVVSRACVQLQSSCSRFASSRVASACS